MVGIRDTHPYGESRRRLAGVGRWCKFLPLREVNATGYIRLL